METFSVGIIEDSKGWKGNKQYHNAGMGPSGGWGADASNKACFSPRLDAR
jgi:hypothetical protein